MAGIKKIFLICFFTLLLYGCGGASDDTVKHEAGKTEIKTDDVQENAAANEERFSGENRLGYYTELDNYFEDEALMYDYVNNMILNGETTIEVYMHGYEGFYIDPEKLAHFNLCDVNIDKMGCNKDLYQITFEIL